MIEIVPFMILSAGVFAGALVSGIAGFAFSAVAGAMLLHVLPPLEAVPLMMICSIAVQSASLVALRRTMRWKGSLALILGGVAGIPPALWLLESVDTRTFRIGVDPVPTVKICPAVKSASTLQPQVDTLIKQIADGTVNPETETKAVAGG